MGGGTVILEEAPSIKMEMLHHRKRVITQSNFV